MNAKQIHRPRGQVRLAVLLPVLVVSLIAGAFADAERTNTLVAVLRSDAGVEEKAKACRQLGEIGTVEAVPALVDLLSDKVLCTYARAGLERIADPRAAAALRQALETTKGDYRVGVINSLSAIRDPQAVGSLKALAADDDPQTASAALLALGRIASDQGIEFVRKTLIDGADETRPDAAAACLLAAHLRLEDGDTVVARGLYDAVRAANVPLTYHVGATRGAIMARDGKEQVAHLVEHLHSENPAIRNVALLTIRGIPSATLADALHAELESAADDLKVPLITALKDCHNAKSFVVVRSALEDRDAAVRMAALNALGNVGGSDATVASALLGVVAARRAPAEVSTAIDLLVSTGSAEADEPILQALRRAEDTSLRVELIDVLGKRKSKAGVAELLKQAQGESGDVRLAALRAVRGLAGPEEVPPLIAVVNASEGDPERTAAVSAVISACTTDGSNEMVLRELRNARDRSQRQAWIRVLTATGYARALPVITATLKDPDPKVVSATISQLGNWPDPTPVDDLLAIAEAKAAPDLRKSSLAAALQLVSVAAEQKQRTDDVLIGWLRRADEAVGSVGEKRQFVSALARVKDIRSLAMLSPYLEDASVKTESVYAVVSVVEALAKGNNAADRAAAKAALDSIAGVEDRKLVQRIDGLKRQLAEK